MFSYAAELECAPLALEHVLELHVSVNRPQIAAEGLDAQEAQAYFLSGHGASGIEAYIYLRMLASQKALLYRWQGNISKSDYSEVREAATQFSESMGFMMEDMQFRRIGADEKRRLAAEYGVFSPMANESSRKASEEVVVLDEPVSQIMMPEESILDLSLDAPSTQVGYETASRLQGGVDVENPLEDKNFKVFLRLLTSV